MSDEQEVVHAEPLWRSKSDFIIGVELEEEGLAEQLWARRLGDRAFEICCVPFFAYDLALGDVVETDDSFSVTRVTASSGRYVFRVWLAESELTVEDVRDLVGRLGGAVEVRSPNLVAVDVPDQVVAQQVADELRRLASTGALTYETGRSL